ncbi:pilin [Actinoplanes sp. NBRC 103695]|uniref:pilin n=1 Tax=Actinoplanes sp. NBRC 103695 TaxID=3032202 RepID=UPI0024A28950|nr:pilin [Actinoplanes sp. NBRC 103695]GLY98848.1 hypothetical protein Acsp02_61020 [Actinoplanes sp. NBRC 103695]
MNPVVSPRHEAADRRRLVVDRRRRPTGRHLRRYPPRAVRVGLAVLLGGAATALCVIAAPHAAYAAEPGTVVLAVDSIDQVVNNIRLWLVGILASWATLCLTVGFLRYTSGEPGEVEKGKLALRSAAIGYAGALLAPLLVTIIAKWVA